MLPVRLGVYAALMAVVYPPTLALSTGRAVYQRLKKGTPDMILPTGAITPISNGGGYAGQMYFAKRLDVPRLTAAFESMVADAGVPSELGKFNLPAMAWDGSSCFNFMKELLHRYCGGRPNDVYRAGSIRLSERAAAALRGPPGRFGAYLLRLPGAVLRNVHSYLWSGLCSGPEAFGGGGLGLHGAVLNLTPEESSRLARGLKRRGASPFAGLTYAAVSAYEHATGRPPSGIVQQASLVTSAFEPVVEERNLIGDWLVGPFQAVGADGPYTLERAEAAYRTLRHELAHTSGAVARAYEAKAYGVLNGGAASFEAVPTLGDGLELMDSVFFNNYGTRSIHEDAACLGWNWGAPFKLGCNCIYVNGRTCICFASSVLGSEALARARDHAKGVLEDLMD